MGIVYRSEVTPVDGSTEALVIHCSSAPYQAEMHDFLAQGLRLRKYSLIAVPGGAQALTLVEFLPKFAWAGWRWTKFLVDLDKPQRLVLLGHQDCLWYTRMLPSRGTATVKERVIADLHKARHALAERFPGSTIETYYAGHAGNEAFFERV